MKNLKFIQTGGPFFLLLSILWACQAPDRLPGQPLREVLIAEKDTVSGGYQLLQMQGRYQRYFQAGLPDPVAFAFSNGEKGVDIIVSRHSGRKPIYYLATYGYDHSRQREVFLRLELTEKEEGLVLENKERNTLLMSFCKEAGCVMKPGPNSATGSPGPCFSLKNQGERCIKATLRYEYQWPPSENTPRD